MNKPKKARKGSASGFVHLWKSYSFPNNKQIKFMSTDLRDGLQQPGLKQPSIEESIYLLQANLQLGVTDIELGFPANKQQKDRAVALASYIRKHNLPVVASCLARTVKSDIDCIEEVAYALGKPVEVILIIGSSKIRRLVENWDLNEMENWTRECIHHARKKKLTVNYLTEDGTRSEPKVLKKLYGAALEERVNRVTIADTVGVVDPAMTKHLMKFFTRLVQSKKKKTPIDFHPHNDLRMAVPNALTAFEHGADRIHTTLHGIGERAGNVDLFTLAIASHERGIYEQDLSKMHEIAQTSAKIYGLDVSVNQPVVGNNAHSTQTGMHAAAIKKAEKMNRPGLTSLVYAPYPAEKVGQQMRIDVGPLSGITNIFVALERIGIPATDDAIKAVQVLVEEKGSIVGDQEIELFLHRKGLYD